MTQHFRSVVSHRLIDFLAAIERIETRDGQFVKDVRSHTAMSTKESPQIHYLPTIEIHGNNGQVRKLLVGYTAHTFIRLLARLDPEFQVTVWGAVLDSLLLRPGMSWAFKLPRENVDFTLIMRLEDASGGIAQLMVS